MWKRTGKCPIEVSDKRKKRGRPKKYGRIKEATESTTNPTKATREGMTVTCSNCKNTCHNKSTCKNQPVQAAPKRKRGRPKKHLVSRCSFFTFVFCEFYLIVVLLQDDDDPWSVENAPKRWRAAQTQTTPAASQSQNHDLPQHSSAPAATAYPSSQGKPRGRPKGVKNGEGKGKKAKSTQSTQPPVPKQPVFFMSPWSDKVFDVWQPKDPQIFYVFWLEPLSVMQD